MKTIFVRDIREGDVIQLNEKTQITVRGTLTEEHGSEMDVFIRVLTEDSANQHILRPGDVVGLLHRPSSRVEIPPSPSGCGFP